MEKSSGDDAARGVGMCDKFLTFLVKSLSLNKQKNITEGPRNANHSSSRSNNNQHTEEDGDGNDDYFNIQIEKAEFEYHGGENNNTSSSINKTILEESGVDEQKKEGQVASEPAVMEEKVKKSVTIKEDKEMADKDAAKKPRKGLRPRMPAILRVPSNINERSQIFIDERKKSFS